MFFNCFFSCCIGSCKKYPEGGSGFRIKKKLDGGLNNEHVKQWKLVLFEVNGIDSTKQFKSKKSQDRFSYYDVQILPDNRAEGTFFIKTEVTSFKMKLSRTKTFITISPNETLFTDAVNCYRSNICERNIFMPFAKPDHVFNWDIRVLTNDKLSITLEDINSYRISLEYADPV